MVRSRKKGIAGVWQIQEYGKKTVGIWELILLVGLTLLTAVIWYAYYQQHFIGLLLNDAMDYAGIARNVAEGEGFISQYLTPLSLVHQGVPQADMWRAPLWPLVLAGFQGVFGFIDEASAFGTGFFFIITTPLVFLLARCLFSSTVAVASTLLYMGSPVLLAYSISGMTESMSVFFMVLCFLVLLSPKTTNRWGDVLLGLVLGLFYLTRYNALVFLPFLALFRAYQCPGKRAVAVLRVLAGFLLATLPWLIRNTIIFGNPFFSLQKYEIAMFTKTYPDYLMYGLPEKVDALGFAWQHIQEIGDKIAQGWASFISMATTQEFWGIVPLIVLLFFLPIGWRQKQVGWWKVLVILLFGLQMAALLVIHFIPRLFLIFTPLLLIGGIGSLVTLLSQGLARGRKGAGRQKALLALGTGVILVAGIVSYWNYSQYPVAGGEKTMWPEEIAALDKLTGAEDLVLTNEGHLVSWYGNRYAVKLPYAIEMIPQIQALHPVQALYLSDRILWHMPEVENEWKNIYYNRPEELYGLHLSKVFWEKDVCKGVLYVKDGSVASE